MKTLSTLIFALLILTPSYGQSKKEIKKQEKQINYEKTKQLIQAGDYYFKAATARSQRGKTRQVQPDGFFLKIEGDKAEAYLIFFGQSQTPGYGGTGGGFEFNNEGVKYDITYDDKKKIITVKFKANNESENYNVSLSIQSSGRSTLYIQSSRRDAMNYNGTTSAFK